MISIEDIFYSLSTQKTPTLYVKKKRFIVHKNPITKNPSEK